MTVARVDLCGGKGISLQAYVNSQDGGVKVAVGGQRCAMP